MICEVALTGFRSAEIAVGQRITTTSQMTYVIRAIAKKLNVRLAVIRWHSENLTATENVKSAG